MSTQPLSSQYLDTEKRFAINKDYTRLNEYDFSMRTAPATSLLRYVIVPGTVKKLNNEFLDSKIIKIQETQPKDLYIPSYITQAPLAKITYEDSDYVMPLNRKY